MCKKGYVWDPATCSCENIKDDDLGKYLGSITQWTCDEIIETTKTVPTNCDEKR